MYHPISLIRLDDEGEAVETTPLHAVQVNNKAGSESYDDGAGQYHLTLVFRVAWSHKLEAMRYRPMHYHIVYQGQTFRVVGYDDYMERHLWVDITAVAYG